MNPHHYLMDENPHFFYPTLAERLGLNEAIVLQQIHGWIQTYLKDPKKYQEKHWHDGAWWVWDSYPDWHKKLPYLSESTIKRTLTGLREQGIVKVANYNTLQIDRTLWYTIDYETYDKLWSDGETNLTSPSDQNDQMEETNLTSPLPVLSSVPSSVGEGADAPHAPPQFADEEIPRSVLQAGIPADLDDLWPEDVAALGEEEQPEENPAEKQVERMRAKMGSDPFSVGAYCQQRQEEEGAWTVPAHRGLSPACSVFKEATGYSPAKAVREDIDAAIPLNEEALHNWYEVAHGWILAGNKWSNVGGMLEWYAEGRTGYAKPQGDGRNGGSSGPRQSRPVESDPDLEDAYNRIFDENGNRRPEYK